MESTKVQPEVKTEQQLMEEFVKAYNELCDKHGFQMVVNPAWKLSQDTGTWQVVLQWAVGKLPKKE